MNDKEYTYDIDKYNIGVDENGEDGIGLTVAKVENGEIYFLGNCYGENARCLDLLIKENAELKKQLEEYKNPIKYFKYANKNVTEENKQLKAQIEEYQKALDETMSEKIDIQNNWNELKEYIDIKLYNMEYLQKLCGCRLDDVNHLILEIIKNEIQEMEKNYGNVENNT